MFLAPDERRFLNMKEEYIQKIVELLQQCNDMSLIDLIFQLLQKSR